jgi:hypothetical protein
MSTPRNSVTCAARLIGLPIMFRRGVGRVLRG